MARHFLPEKTLEEWALSDKADLKEGRLIVASDKGSFAVSPAVHFTQVVSGTDDGKLVGKVRTTQQLEKLAAEHMADSVILGENAYEVVPGYIVDVAPAEKGGKKKTSNSDADLLADFLINKL